MFGTRFSGFAAFGDIEGFVVGFEEFFGQIDGFALNGLVGVGYAGLCHQFGHEPFTLAAGKVVADGGAGHFGARHPFETGFLFEALFEIVGKTQTE